MPHTDIISVPQLEAIVGSPDTVVFDVRFSLSDEDCGRKAYQAAHLPGAVYLHLNDDLSGQVGPATGRHPLPSVARFTDLMRGAGVSEGTQVIAYDDAGGAFAARLWWLLKWLNHSAVALLDGGFQAWLAAGGTTDALTPAARRESQFTPVEQRQLVFSADEVSRGLQTGAIVLVDARAPERFRGEIEPIDTKAGHVRGAVNIPYMHNLRDDGHFKATVDLREIHSQTQAGRKVVCMCGSGVTACHNILANVISGNDMPVLYGGSWSEWITDPNRKIETADSVA